ncbi:MAG: CBS domain-containing protein [Eubacteriaceae bacterium]|nr:CBS domain-containing protein [Eubacteriaceae bacterium]
MNTEDFINLYKELERVLFEKYGQSGDKYENSVLRFINSERGRPYKDTLDICREMRNLLSHYPKEDGKYIFQPSDDIVLELSSIVNKLKNPITAKDFAIRNIFTVKPDTRAKQALSSMQERGFSHAPMISAGRLTGVFSISTLITFSMKYGGAVLKEDTTVSDFAEFLPIDKHSGEYFAFAPPKALPEELNDLFSAKRERKRLAIIFITDTGKPSGKLSGMITPWDLIDLRDEAGEVGR